MALFIKFMQSSAQAWMHTVCMCLILLYLLHINFRFNNSNLISIIASYNLCVLFMKHLQCCHMKSEALSDLRLTVGNKLRTQSECFSQCHRRTFVLYGGHLLFKQAVTSQSFCLSFMLLDC